MSEIDDNNVYIECIFGDCYGQKFMLKDGVNKIGKGYQMDVCITDDVQITRDNHCTIVCDMKMEKYIIIPTVGSLTYLNNTLLRESTEINNKDVFRIGRSNFVFISK